MPQDYKIALSGADVKCWVNFNETPDIMIPLKTINSINLSVHESRGAVRSLGYKGVKGFTGSVRTIAGSMILQQLAKHPLKDLMDSVYDYLSARGGRVPQWSADWNINGVGSFYGLDYTNRLLGSIPPFNIILMYKSEHVMDSRAYSYRATTARTPDGIPEEGTSFNFRESQDRGASEMLVGVNFVTQAKTISIDDGLIQIAAEFVAQDYKPFTWDDDREIQGNNGSYGVDTSNQSLLKAILFNGGYK